MGDDKQTSSMEQNGTWAQKLNPHDMIEVDTATHKAMYTRLHILLVGGGGRTADAPPPVAMVTRFGL